MVRIQRLQIVIALMLATAWVGAVEPPAAVPLIRAHAHNDYQHRRPLLDALMNGFCSVEADVYLVNGQLLVAHDRDKVKPERTLVALYLNPLRQLVRRNGGQVFRNGPSFTLLLDVKSDAAPTCAALHEILKDYAEVLTSYRGKLIETKAITVIISGNRAPEKMSAQLIRYAAIDGRRDDLESNSPAGLVPLISVDWNTVFSWRWQGAMPETERTALQQWVERTHAQGRKARFWNTPDNVGTWRLLYDAGVDLINTDDLPGLRKFLLGQPADQPVAK